MKARDLVKPGESAVALCTSGRLFVRREDGTGSTGNWVINPKKAIDKIIIYKREPNGNKHEIFVGNLVAIGDSEEEGRRQINMANIRLAGTTTYNWQEFTETKRGAINRVKYISHLSEEPSSRTPPKERTGGGPAG